MNLEQIKDMFNKGFKDKNLEGLIFHSDQGSNNNTNRINKD